jgi:hypothetical protein
VTDDYDGQVRPIGAHPDIGADELDGDGIFANGFEDGDASAWSSCVGCSAKSRVGCRFLELNLSRASGNRYSERSELLELPKVSDRNALVASIRQVRFVLADAIYGIEVDPYQPIAPREIEPGCAQIVVGHQRPGAAQTALVELVLDSLQQTPAKSASADDGVEGDDLARRSVDVIGHQTDQVVEVIDESETLDIGRSVNRVEPNDEAEPTVFPHLLDFLCCCNPETHIVLSKWRHINLPGKAREFQPNIP